ncbi:MAG: hypothetical protein KGK16_14365, partial [Bradyrhizobium sp.]|nr:hypothetical protein [Bradyrhizobium sp.]
MMLRRRISVLAGAAFLEALARPSARAGPPQVQHGQKGCNKQTAGAENSLRKLKALEAMQFLLDPGFQIPASALARDADPAPFPHQELALPAIGLQIDSGGHACRTVAAFAAMERYGFRNADPMPGNIQTQEKAAAPEAARRSDQIALMKKLPGMKPATISVFGSRADAPRSCVRFAGGSATFGSLAFVDAAGETVDQPHIVLGGT